MSPRADSIPEADLDWTRFDKLFRPASAEAAGIVERLLAGETVPGPESRDVASQVNLRLRHHALFGKPPPKAVKYLDKLSERFFEKTDGIDTKEEARVTKALLGVDQLLREASASEAMAPDTALEELGRARRILAEIGQPASARKPRAAGPSRPPAIMTPPRPPSGASSNCAIARQSRATSSFRPSSPMSTASAGAIPTAR